MLNFLRIIRLPNLLVIALTQVLIQYFVIQPILISNGYALSISFLHFLYLVLATILIAASGYIINDYFDIKVDYINRPNKVIVGAKLSKKTTFIFYVFFLTLGLFFGCYMAIYNQMIEFIFVFAIISGLLYFYSYSYSKQLLIGNIVIASLTAMVPFIIGLCEIKSIFITHKIKVLDNLYMINQIKYWVFGYSAFAFISTFIREIIKDAEDFEGDLIDSRSTIPISLGILSTKIILLSLIIIMLSSIIFIYLRYIGFELFSFIYIFLTLIISGIYLIYLIWNANKKKDYSITSNLLKFIMVSGILFSVIYTLRYY